jgi:hypothetical protein
MLRIFSIHQNAVLEITFNQLGGLLSAFFCSKPARSRRIASVQPIFDASPRIAAVSIEFCISDLP